jgi:PAS domain S-box-containing protein
LDRRSFAHGRQTALVPSFFTRAFEMLKSEVGGIPSSLAASGAHSQSIILLCRLIQLQRARFNAGVATDGSTPGIPDDLGSALDEYDRLWRAGVENSCRHLEWETQSVRPIAQAGSPATSPAPAPQPLAPTVAQESELILHAFMEHAPVGMYVKDAEGRYLLANPEMRKVFGRPPSEVIGKTVADVFGPEEAEMIAGYDRMILASGLPETAIEHLPGIDDFEWSLVMRFPILNGATQPMIGGFDIDITQQKRIEERLQAAREAYEAQSRALRYQMNPHFLFNTLSSIATLVADGQSSEAEGTVLKLARFYRYALALDPTRKIPLRQEILLQSLYFEVESIRFADRLHVEIDVPAPVRDALVPCLLLQPLIENSIEFGMREVGRVLHFKVIARQRGGRLHIHVLDDGRGGSSKGGAGVGLPLTKRRLDSAFNGRCGFKARSRGSEGFHVCLSMPLEFASCPPGPEETFVATKAR